jgi:hypothetical protein
MIEGTRAGSGPRTNGSRSRRPKKHTDPDSQHCLQVFLPGCPYLGWLMSLARPLCWIKRTCPLVTLPGFSLLLLRPYLGWLKSLARPQCWIKKTCPAGSVVDRWHFGTDLDTGICTSDKRIRILIFSSVIFKMARKNYFFLPSFAYYF